MTEFFNKDVLKSVENQRKKLKENIEEFQKARAEIPEDEIEAVTQEFQEHYLEQLGFEVEDREVYYRDEAAFIVFQTPDEFREFANGKSNKPTQTKNASWRIVANFPLMTPEDAAFPKRITVFVSDEMMKEIFGELKYWKVLVAAKGRLTVDYQNVADETTYVIDGEEFTVKKAKFAEKLEKFLERNYIDSLEEIDESDYVKYYTFNLDQVLQKVKLK
jgi:hypothetical protein